MDTTEQEYAGAFKTWWRKRSFYAKNFIVLDLIALFVLMVALIASAASSNASSSSDTSSYSPTVPAPTSMYSEADYYLADVRPYITYYNGTPVPDYKLMGWGQSACDLYSRGVSGNQWVTMMVQANVLDVDGAVTIHDAAIPNLCPELL